MSNYHNQQIMNNPILKKEKEYKTDRDLLVCGNCKNLIRTGLFAFTREECINESVEQEEET